MILLVDNYDSFVYNLKRYLVRLGQQVVVVRNDQMDLDDDLVAKYLAIVISPGPQSPDQAGGCLELIRRFHDRLPMLGVCLGHQALGEAFGAQVVRGERPVHGKVTAVRHRSERLFAGCPTPMMTARYHSLIVERTTLPAVFDIDAESEDGVIMALSHRERTLYGIQFHPESFGTNGGDMLITNFLKELS